MVPHDMNELSVGSCDQISMRFDVSIRATAASDADATHRNVSSQQPDFYAIAVIDIAVRKFVAVLAARQTDDAPTRWTPQDVFLPLLFPPS